MKILVSSDDGEMRQLERSFARLTAFQRSGHQVAQVEVGGRDVSRQCQFEVRFRRILEGSDHVDRSLGPGVDHFALRRVPATEII
jgi:hypothetical protein